MRTVSVTDRNLSFDDQLDVVGHVRRRQVLFALLNRAPGESVDPLAIDRLVDRRALVLELRHVHLPKLAAFGVIETEGEAATVRRGPTFGQIEPLLELLIDHRERLSGQLA